MLGLESASSKLASFSNLASTSYNRHIQTIYEHGDRRNPDILASAFMTPKDRDQCLRLPARTVTEMRRSPYYYYLTARTKFYDQLLLNSVAAGIRRVVIVGAGNDTRFYRFGSHLATFQVDVAECDQPEAISTKQRLAAALPHADRVQYFGIDLNIQSSWEGLWQWLSLKPGTVLVVSEGVSPYIESSSFQAFLKELADALPEGSTFAYDFKQSGAADDFGRTSNVASPFRLPLNAETIHSFHDRAGFKQAAVTTSLSLMETYIPSWNSQVSPLFQDDALIHATR
jgi:methyltransferase (TIGR00027 family)